LTAPVVPEMLPGMSSEASESATTEPEIVSPAKLIAAIVAEVADRRVPEAPIAPPREGPAAQERPPPPAAYKPPDFAAIFRQLGLAEKETECVARASELLRLLPRETPPNARRQIAAGMLQAFAMPPDKITEATSRAIDALEIWLGRGEQELREKLDTVGKRIQELRAEESRLAKELSERQASHHTTAYDTHIRQAELRNIVEFFRTELGGES
jgi:hypothetical protein